jgi:hypothetical protein
MAESAFGGRVIIVANSPAPKPPSAAILETPLAAKCVVEQYIVEVVVVVKKTKYSVGSKISPQLRQGPTSY